MGGPGTGGGSRPGGRWRGQGTFHPPCHILHCHMVLCPEGTSHNKPTNHSAQTQADQSQHTNTSTDQSQRTNTSQPITGQKHKPTNHRPETQADQSQCTNTSQLITAHKHKPTNHCAETQAEQSQRTNTSRPITAQKHKPTNHSTQTQADQSQRTNTSRPITDVPLQKSQRHPNFREVLGRVGSPNMEISKSLSERQLC